MKFRLTVLLTIFMGIAGLSAMAKEESQKLMDPGKPDQIILDSVLVKPGQNAEIALRVIVDDTTSFTDKNWVGIGSFCIPLKYEKAAMTVDSVKFRNTLLKWDATFANAKTDTGFVSLAGIYTLTGNEKPPLFSPVEPMEIVRLFITAKADAKPGTYAFALTKDPRQGEVYFGSIDGYHSWQPVFNPGKVVIQ